MDTRIHEEERFRNRHRIFADRAHAGAILAEMVLSNYPELEDGMVLAIPSGGVPVGLELSLRLRVPLDLIIVRKLQIPGNPEAGFGALSLDGEIFLNQEILPFLELDRNQIDREVDRVKQDLEARNRLFRQERPQPSVVGKTVLIADDGLASGYTMLAAASSVRRGGAGRIMVAVPTASLQALKSVSRLADEIYCPNVCDTTPFAVAEAYRSWHDLMEQEVRALLEKRRQWGK